MLEQNHLNNKYLKQKNNMNEKLSLSIILPIKSSKSRDFNEYFEKAITSIKSQTVDIKN
jgi:hypothetical protein